jgi:hypothetical protein
MIKTKRQKTQTAHQKNGLTKGRNNIKNEDKNPSCFKQTWCANHR